MNLSDQEIAELANFASEQFNGRIIPNTVREISATGLRVADATGAFYVDGTTPRDDSVLIVSAPDFPDSIHESVSAARCAHALLKDGREQRICVPIVADRWRGISFALYPRLEGFSQNRYVRRLQKRRTPSVMLDWLVGVLKDTAVEHQDSADVEQRFHIPLENLIRDADIPPHLRDLARMALDAVESRRVRTVTCLQHGDLWSGNVMFKRSAIAGLGPFLRQFKVIDWGSSRTDGYPGIDLVRFLFSTIGPGRHSARLIEIYCRSTGLTATDMSVCCMASLGRLSAELYEFPKPGFIAMMEGVGKLLDRSRALEDLRRLKCSA
ncbi:MAG: DUF1679 domain-containing protein [Tabrizicola sp.]|jgi:hypothetical protein|nr:DUF1679 domain-containing protein [Tabrizicola sp.]